MILQGRHLMLGGEHDRHKGSIQKTVGHETKRDEGRRTADWLDGRWWLSSG